MRRKAHTAADATRVAGFLDRFTPLELMAADLHDPATLRRLGSTAVPAEAAGDASADSADAGLGAAELEAVKAHQRLYRLFPHTGPTAVASARGLAGALMELGFTSAHEIAAVPPAQFVADHAGALGGAGAAAEVHRRAGQIRAAARHLFANVRDVASPWVRQLLGPALDPELQAYFEKLPGYQELFGSLDYLACRHCDSIFGPAAYFLDIMRITDAYITTPGSPTIPPHRKLRDRRPDLFTLELTCANTNDPIPYVSLVVEILLKKLVAGGVADPLRSLSTAAYPFNLPWNEPLARTAIILDRAGASYSTVVDAMRSPDPAWPLYPSVDIAAPALGLSPEQVRAFTTASSDDAKVAAQYGLASLAAHLPAAGAGTLTATAGERKATGSDQPGTKVMVGQQIGFPGTTPTVPQTLRTVTRIVSSDEIEVDTAWDASISGPWLVFPLEDLSTVGTFRSRASIASYDDVVALFGQDLSTAEVAAGLGRSLFINATGEAGLPDLAIVQGDGPTGDPANPVARIVGWSAARFDRLSRLLRLSRATDLPLDLLDWLVVQQGGEITADFLVRLASLVRLATETGLTLAQAAGFPYPLKTLGQVSAAVLADPFDLLFNPAPLVKGRPPYASPDPIPFDPSRPLLWPPAAGPDWNAGTGTARGGGTDTIVLADGASSEDGAYVGLAIALVSGAGSGQTAVVRAYAGTTRTATVYAPWRTQPDTSSAYRVGVAPGVTERLAAALQVRAADLQPLGDYLAAGLGTPGAPLSLTLANLTALWRLAAIARRFRMATADYLALRRLAGLPAAPPATAQAGMEDFAASVDAAAWMERSALTVAELEYVITGVAPRALRLSYDPSTLPASVDSLARSSTDTLLTPKVLAAQGFIEEEAQALFEALVTAGYADGRGVILPAPGNFAAAAARFPVTPATFVGPEVTQHQAEVTVGQLQTQHPPYLQAGGGSDSTLLYAYPAGSSLSFLFAGVPDATPKRTRFANVLDGVARKVGFTEFAGFLPVTAAASFVSADIGPEQSKQVFSVLETEGVLLKITDDTARLSAEWTPATPLPGLFESAAAGQSRTIDGYDGTKREATVDPAWNTVPDAFAVYRVVSVQNAGTARAGGEATLQLAEAASPDDGAYVGAALLLTAGPGAGDLRWVVAYDGATRTALVDAKWSTTPTDATGYQAGPVVAGGSARSGGARTIVFDLSAATADGAYVGCAVALIPDAQQTRKVEEVRAALAETVTRVTSLQASVATAKTAQVKAAAQGLSGILALPVSRIDPLLPLATGEYTLLPYLAGLLTPAPAGVLPERVVELADGLSRSGLAASRTAVSDDALRGMARQPALYGLNPGDSPSFAGIRAAAAVPIFAGSVGNDQASLITYFDVDPALVGADGKRAALQRLTGWEAAQTTVLETWLNGLPIGWTGIGDMAGVRRMQPVFAVMARLGADAAVLVRMAQLAPLPPLGGTDTDAVWAACQGAADAAHGLLGVRYEGADLAVASDHVARSVASATRDALLGYTIAWLQAHGVPEVRTASDLFTYLLVDVEMTGCDTTSKIAQGITSVQLYMQRVRMGVEPGADTGRIPEVWWSWMSAYRMWEANRKVFLYPENYLEPALRKDASPQFETLKNELMQGRPSDENAARAMENYFDGFQEVATLTHVGGVKLNSVPREGGQVDEPCFLIARTNTTPYRYHVRAFTRSLLPDAVSAGAPAGEAIVWQPWTEIEASIDSAEVTPVFAFDRLFLFWNEIAPTKTSKVTSDGASAQSATESTWQVTLRYTFRGSTGTWVSSQALEQPLVMRTMPNDYPPLVQSSYVTAAYAPNQSYWGRPYAQQVPRGIPATGTLTFAAGAIEARGTGTVLERQLRPGDSVWVAGEERIVDSVDTGAQTLRVLASTPFTDAASQAPFKVVPRDATVNRFAPFTGPGTVETSTTLRRVTGYGTRFLRDLSPGDSIQVGNETRTVVGILDDTTLEVDRVWKQGSEVAGQGQIGIWPRLYTVDGYDADFQQTLVVGDQIRAVGQTRIVGDIDSATVILVTQPFDVAQQQTVDYAVLRYYGYTAIPHTRGDERLMVFYGPNFDLRASLPVPVDAGQTDNPGDDPFIAARNEFNRGLYSALRLAQAIRNTYGDIPGDLTAEGTLVLNDALDQENVRIFAPAYDASPTPTALPVRAALDHENRVVFVRREERPLLSMYWGNAQPGATQNQTGYGSGDLALLYHVTGATSSLYGWANQIGWYLFNTPGQSYWIARNDPRARTAAVTTMARPFWQPEGPTDLALSFATWTLDTRPFETTRYRFTRLTTSVVQRLKGRLLVGGFDRLLALDSQALPEPPFDEFYEVPGGDPPPAVDASHLPSAVMDFGGAYGPYFWEIFFHAPLLVAQQLRDSGRHADAERWYQHIYNPNAQPNALNEGLERYWRFRPFREGMTIPGLQEILTNPFEINTYNNDPFDPDAIARLRISAYAKTTVMKYIDNLVLWGDALFALDTRESIAQATNLYLVASALLGKRPEVVGELPPKTPQNFDEIQAASPGGVIPQFLIELENSGFVPLSGEGARFADVPVNNIDAYFCVPENTELIACWDRIDDRLFKIRHCMNLQGVERTLALFAPPIDPRQAIAAFGGEGSGGGAGVFGTSPVPVYRFSYLLGLARSLTGNAIGLGSSLLRALESQDAEALAQLRLEQETRVLELNTGIRTLQITMVDQERTALQSGRDSAQARKDYYRDLLATGYLPSEIAQIAYMMTGMVSQGASTILKSAAALGFALPQVGSPFAMTYGGQQVGNGIEQASAALDSFTLFINAGAEVLGIAAMHARRVEEWTLQEKLAGFDVAQFDAQLQANATQKQISQRELVVLETQIAQNEALEAFYRTRFTNQELYAWMAGRLSSAYWQTYQLALDTARMAERALQYDLASAVTVVAPAWSDRRRGLTAGESLMLSLDQLEAAQVNAVTRRSLEITKTISLAQIDPVAFLTFIETGEAIFAFSERLFDADFPGHYRRRIRSLSVSIPAVVGPYRNVSATLTQTANRVVREASLDAVRFLLGDDVTVPAGKIEHNVRADQGIAISVGQADTGVFDAAADSPLLLPFEKTGAVSSWRLSMPPANNAIDLRTLSDVVFELRYTAADGGAGFRRDVASLPQLRERSWSGTVQAARQFPGEWQQFMAGPVAGAKQRLSMTLANLVQPNVARPALVGFYLRLVVPEGATTTSRIPYIALAAGGEAVVFGPGAQHAFLGTFERPVPLSAAPLPVEVAFDLATDATPPDLRTAEGDRLSPEALRDVELVLFLTGTV